MSQRLDEGYKKVRGERTAALTNGKVMRKFPAFPPAQVDLN